MLSCGYAVLYQKNSDVHRLLYLIISLHLNCVVLTFTLKRITLGFLMFTASRQQAVNAQTTLANLSSVCQTVIYSMGPM